MHIRLAVDWWRGIFNGKHETIEKMVFPYAPKIRFPLDNFETSGDEFLKDCEFDGTRWGLHLGQDSNVPSATSVKAIGRGRVVYSEAHFGKVTSLSGGGLKVKRNWGNIIIIAHKHRRTKKNFFSLYGHLGVRLKERGDQVEMGQSIGLIARANTQENGFWEDAHLHFAIYTGPYPWVKPSGERLTVLPGYYLPKSGNETLTRPEWWEDPVKFVKEYPS